MKNFLVLEICIWIFVFPVHWLTFSILFQNVENEGSDPEAVDYGRQATKSLFGEKPPHRCRQSGRQRHAVRLQQSGRQQWHGRRQPHRFVVTGVDDLLDARQKRQGKEAIYHGDFRPIHQRELQFLYQFFLKEKLHQNLFCWSFQGLQSRDRHLFLFNDLLLIAKARSGGHFKLKDKVRISELWLSTGIEEVAEGSAGKSRDTSFVIGWPPSTNLVATFRYFFIILILIIFLPPSFCVSIVLRQCRKETTKIVRFLFGHFCIYFHLENDDTHQRVFSYRFHVSFHKEWKGREDIKFPRWWWWWNMRVSRQKKKNGWSMVGGRRCVPRSSCFLSVCAIQPCGWRFFYSGNRWERRKTGIRSRNRSTLLAHGCKTVFNALELPGTYDPQPFSLFLKKKEES